MPAPQIVGAHRDLDLRVLQERGVKLVGKAIGLDQDQVNHHSIISFEDGLTERLSTADAKLTMLLDKIDAWIDQQGIDAPPAGKVILPVPCPASPSAAIDLEAENVQTIIWATGYERSYPWLQNLPSNILDESSGSILEDRGVTAEPGVFVLGMRFQRTRISNFIDGVGADAEQIAGLIAAQGDC